MYPDRNSVEHVHASVLWSPDSHKLAINDYAGSDFTNNLVLSVNTNTPPFDLKNEVLRSLAGHEIPTSDHLYMSFIRWRSGSQLELIAWGHGEEAQGGFCQCFLVSLNGNVRQCKLHGGNSDPEKHCEKLKR